MQALKSSSEITLPDLAIISPMLDERSRILLKHLIETYINDGQPVGSHTLLKSCGLDLSSATIRNVMADLEALGMVASPHTSAGRMPTQRGYRFFVDSLMTVKPLAEQQIEHLKEELSSADPSELIHNAANQLSSLTRFAGVVLLPKRHEISLKHLEFIPLTDKRVLVVIVSSDDQVQNRIIAADRSYSAAELVTLSNLFSQHYATQPIPVIQQKIRAELTQMQHDMRKLMDLALEASSKALENEREHVVIAGERNLLLTQDLSGNLDTLRQLFELFEQRTTLLQLLDSSHQAQGIQIYIGGENGYLPISECSIVTAPFIANGQLVGSLGVIGPTRMAYERVVPIVDITAKLLSNAMGM